MLTRLDILDGFESVKICVGYQADGEDVTRFPANTSLLARCQPVYEELPGWTSLRPAPPSYAKLPANAVALHPPHRGTGGLPRTDSLHRPQPRRDHQLSPVFE